MRTTVSYPGTGIFAQQVARAFFERDSLAGYITTFAFNKSGMAARALGWAPQSIGAKLNCKLERRSIASIPWNYVHTRPLWEIARTAASQLSADPTLPDLIWDRMSHDFDRWVARCYVPNTAAIYAYEYTAIRTFELARSKGVARLLDLPSLNNREFELIHRAEKEKFPELKSRTDDYFRRRFEQRQARRDAEVELADVIVANSSLTMRSHIAGGADPSKVVVVPLAAPPASETIKLALHSERPLRVIWAGNFSIGKGAHYFLEAWKALRPGSRAQASVYGSMGLPESALHLLPEEISFRGSVTQTELFAAFDVSDVLVFPTLSDGFGMVVTEAFARGVPVVTTDRAGASDLVRHGQNGLIIPAGDALALRDALQWCLDNRQMLYEMRYAALTTAKRWQWSDYRRKFIEEVSGGLSRAGYTPAFNNELESREVV